MNKIIHFNAYDIGGAAKAVFRFHESLLANGFESWVIVLKQRQVGAKNVIAIKLSFFEKLIFYYSESRRRLIYDYTKKEYNFFAANERHGLPASILLKRLPFKPDIIFIHWISGFLTAKTIYQLSKNTGALMLWRFNDLNAFTGGCHYANGCLNYQKACGNCPALNKPSPNDISAINLKEKIKWLSKANMIFLSSTTEIDEQLRSSSVGKACTSRLIMLSVNNPAYRFISKTLAREKMGLPLDKKILFFGANDLGDARKGMKELLTALKYLRQLLTYEEAESVLLVFASRLELPVIDWPFAFRQIPFMKTEDELATAYAAATIMLSPSVEDAGPMMIAEAMLCGTPIVAFEIGLAKDIIIDDVTGKLIPRFDTYKFATGIKEIIQLNENDFSLLSKKATEIANEKVGLNREIADYRQLFVSKTKEG